MPDPDFNLLAALDVLLAEGSVAGAAKALGLSDSAMSRALLRLRAATATRCWFGPGGGWWRRRMPRRFASAPGF